MSASSTQNTQYQTPLIRFSQYGKMGNYYQPTKTDIFHICNSIFDVSEIKILDFLSPNLTDTEKMTNTS